MTRLPYNPTSGSAACEPFKPFGIEPGLVKQVREKFQSEISMRELSRNLQNGMKHHSATARLTSAYHNLLHNEGGILRHNTYPNRRIQSAGKISDSSNSTDVDIKALSKPLNVEKRSLINKNKRNTGNPENATVPIKNFLDATKSDYRPETAVFRNNSVSVCEYQDRSSHKSSGANEGTCRKSSTFPKLNGYGSKLKETITPSKSINKPHVEFKQPVVPPKPSKSELSKDPLVNFGIPKGYQATKQSSQSIYNADEFHYTCNSSNSPNEDRRSKSPRLKFEVYSSPLNSETTCRGGTTIKIDTRTIQNAGSPTKHTESNYGYMPKNFNFPTNSNHTANESNGQPLTLGNDALPTSSKYSKELKCPLSKADAASDGTQKPPAHTQKSIVNSSAQPNGILKTSVSSVIISDPKVSSSASVSTTSSNVPSPSQSLFNIQNGNFSPHSVKKNLSNEINCNKTFVKNGEHSECEKTSDNFEKIGISFPFNGEISNKTSSPTRRITSLPHKSEFKTNTLTQVLPSHIKFNPDDVMKASVSSVETGESEKSPDFIKDSTVLERNEVKKQSHDKVAGYFSSQDAGKVHLSEFDTTPKDKIRSCSLPYHKRQVNHSVLDSVMGEMEQLFSGKQTNALSKQPRILSFAREKAMQYREEKENDLDNPAKFGNVMESTETSVNDQKTVAQNPNEHAPTASTSSKQQRQSESFQAALQAVEKNLKLTSATENNQSSNFETVANDSIKRTSRSFVTIRPGFPAVKTSLAEECNNISQDLLRYHENLSTEELVSGTPSSSTSMTAYGDGKSAINKWKTTSCLPVLSPIRRMKECLTLEETQMDDKSLANCQSNGKLNSSELKSNMECVKPHPSVGKPKKSVTFLSPDSSMIHNISNDSGDTCSENDTSEINSLKNVHASESDILCKQREPKSRTNFPLKPEAEGLVKLKDEDYSAPTQFVSSGLNRQISQQTDSDQMYTNSKDKKINGRDKIFLENRKKLEIQLRRLFVPTSEGTPSTSLVQTNKNNNSLESVHQNLRKKSTYLKGCLSNNILPSSVLTDIPINKSTKQNILKRNNPERFITNDQEGIEGKFIPKITTVVDELRGLLCGTWPPKSKRIFDVHKYAYQKALQYRLELDETKNTQSNQSSQESDSCAEISKLKKRGELRTSSEAFINSFSEAPSTNVKDLEFSPLISASSEDNLSFENVRRSVEGKLNNILKQTRNVDSTNQFWSSSFQPKCSDGCSSLNESCLLDTHSKGSQISHHGVASQSFMNGPLNTKPSLSRKGNLIEPTFSYKINDISKESVFQKYLTSNLSSCTSQSPLWNQSTWSDTFSSFKNWDDSYNYSSTFMYKTGMKFKFRPLADLESSANKVASERKNHLLTIGYIQPSQKLEASGLKRTKVLDSRRRKSKSEEVSFNKGSLKFSSIVHKKNQRDEYQYKHINLSGNMRYFKRFSEYPSLLDYRSFDDCYVKHKSPQMNNVAVNSKEQMNISYLSASSDSIYVPEQYSPTDLKNEDKQKTFIELRRPRTASPYFSDDSTSMNENQISRDQHQSLKRLDLKLPRFSLEYEDVNNNILAPLYFERNDNTQCLQMNGSKSSSKLISQRYSQTRWKAVGPAYSKYRKCYFYNGQNTCIT
ncbi:unnamed protein product [Heterobilharzia americana]|nr:unnamed protein product [Heterobilharzia americana]